MEPLLILIVIPLIAFMVVRADTIRMKGLDQQSRTLARVLMPGFAVLNWFLGLFFLFLILQQANQPIGQMGLIVLSLARLIIGFGLLYFGWKIWKISSHVECEDLPLKELVRRDIDATSTRTTAILFILLPLALPAMIVLAFVGFIPAIVFGVSSHPRRHVQNQLLWTLALAAKSESEFSQEVNNLAFSMNEERYASYNTALQVVGGVLCVLMPLLLLILLPLYFRARSRSRMIEQLFRLSHDLSDGVPLAKALSYQSQLLPPEVIGAVEAAEESGDMKKVLGNLAMYHSRQLEEKGSSNRNFENTIMYAMLIILVLFNVSGFIMYWIIPKYYEIFNDFGVELPSLTMGLIHFADWFASYWYIAAPILLLPIVPFVALSVFYIDDDSWVPSFLVRMFPRIESPSLLRRLGYVAENKLPIAPSLQSLANAMPDYSRSMRYERVDNRLSAGNSLGQALQDEGYINAREAHSIDNAAAIGHLGWALTSIGDAIQQRREDRTRGAMEIVRPCVVIALGVCVGLFCTAMFLPIVKLFGDIS